MNYLDKLREHYDIISDELSSGIAGDRMRGMTQRLEQNINSGLPMLSKSPEEWGAEDVLGVAMGGITKMIPGKEAMRAAQYNAAKSPEMGGLGLRKNNVANERAQAMGYGPETWYHGTKENFPEFKKNQSFNTPTYMAPTHELADDFAGYDVISNSMLSDGGQVMPIRHRGQNIFDSSNPDQMSQLKQQMRDRDISPNKIKGVERGEFNMIEDQETLDLLKDHYDGFNIREVADRQMLDASDFKYRKFNNVEDARALYDREIASWKRISGKDGNKPRIKKLEDGGFEIGYKAGEEFTGQGSPGNYKKNVAIFEPNKIRSKFAAFDPFQKKSANLLATGLLGSMLLNNKEEERPRGLLGM